MQATRLSRILAFLVRDLRLVEIIEYLGEYVEQKSGGKLSNQWQLHSLLYHAKGELQNLKRTSPDAYKVADDFGLTDTFSDETVTHLLSQTSTDNYQIVHLRQDAVAIAFYFGVLTFVGLTNTAVEYLHQQRTPELSEGEEILSLDVTDYGEGLVPVDRLRRILEALSHLYAHVARQVGPDADPPRIALLDSGSDLKVNIVGGAEIIREIRLMFAEAINGIRFWKYDRRDRQTETINKRLETLGSLHDLMNRGAVQGQEADVIRHGIVRDLQTLIGAGAAPADLPNGPDDEVGGILKKVRDTKLLSSGSDLPED